MERRDLRLLALLALGALLLRAMALGYDPPYIGASLGEFADAGWYLLNASSWVLRGDLAFDLGQTWWDAPIHTFLCFLSFRLMGVGEWQAAVPSVIATVAAILLLFLRGRDFDRSVGWSSALLLALDYPWFVYARIAKQEPWICVFGLILLGFLFRSETRSGFGAAVAEGAAVCVKPTGLYLLPAALLRLLRPPVGWRVGFAAGFGVIGIVFIAATVVLHLDGRPPLFLTYAAHFQTPREILTDLLLLDQNLAATNLAFRSPILWFVGIVGAFVLLLRPHDERERWVGACAVFILLGVARYHYAPLRMRLPALAFLAMAAVLFLRRERWGRWEGALAGGFGTLLLLGALRWRWGFPDSIGGIRVAAIAAAGVGMWVGPRVRVPPRALGVALLLSGGLFLFQIGSFWRDRSTLLHDTLVAFARVPVSEGGALAAGPGLWSYQAGLAAGIQVAPADKATHAVVEEETEGEAFRSGFGRGATRIESRFVPRVGRTLSLYRLAPP